MTRIKSIAYRKILNSHVDFTNEFIVELEDGSRGRGGAPQGETISIYEDKTSSTDTDTIINAITGHGYLNVDIDQNKLDDYLQQKIPVFGRNNSYALSLAFFNATAQNHSVFELFDRPEKPLEAPALCMNVLNGGMHAYTNPVLSDFPEFLLVSRNNDIPEVIGDHNRIQRLVREKLNTQTKVVVNGNPVSSFGKADNRAVLEFLLDILDSAKIDGKYDLMIDASAGDLWTEEGYKFLVTDGTVKSSGEMCDYWKSLIEDYGLGFLEDPLHEKDYESWREITTGQNRCSVIGDNFYSTDPRRIEEGAAQRYTHGVLIKPNQAGTVSAVCQAILVARANDQIGITSHRSISTESVFLSTLTCVFGVKYIKIGPLATDYSSVVRLNEIIRLTEKNNV